jgi:dTDP-4-amino-4,6-dideoxygalactose transaminase
LGATYKGKCVGSLGNLTCFSFHPRKVITTGEGGVILTDDRMLPERARVVRAHGMSVSDLVRHQAKSVVIEEYRELGYNYRMTDLQAAVGIEQMKKLDFILVRRQELAARYNDALAKLECVQLPYSPPETPHTYQSYMVLLTPQTPKTRDQVMREMLEAGVATRPGVMAIHLTHYYRTRFPDLRLPITERATRSTVLLPIYPGMSDADQEYVINNLIRVLR